VIITKSVYKQSELNTRGIINAINLLLKHDLIEKRPTGEICIVDPVLAYWLAA